MPFIKCIDLLKAFTHPPSVIVTTAYRDYAVESYDLGVLDYLSKPIAFPRFLRALSKLPSANLKNGNDIRIPGSKADQMTLVKVDKKLIQLSVDDIFYIESLKDYIRIRTSLKDLVTYQTLNGILEKLPPDQFIRIHKSYIVSRSKIEMIEGNQVLVKSKFVPIGPEFKQDLLKVLR